MTSLTLTVLLHASILAASPQPQPEAYDQAFTQSRQNGQPLMILVGADWCPACVVMKSSVMPEVRRRGLLRKVAFAVVNSDRESRLARQLMSGEGIPQLIMYYQDSEGWKRMQVTGKVTPESVEDLISKGVAKSTAKPVSTPIRSKDASK